jgi:hypothetical protein
MPDETEKKEYVYRVTYDYVTNGNPRQTFEVVRTVLMTVANPHDAAVKLGQNWGGRPIKRIEVVNEIEKLTG